MKVIKRLTKAALLAAAATIALIGNPACYKLFPYTCWQKDWIMWNLAANPGCPVDCYAEAWYSNYNISGRYWFPTDLPGKTEKYNDTQQRLVLRSVLYNLA
jgi:hypothetical protein